MKKDFTQPDDRCFGPVEISEGCPIPVAYQASAEDVEDSVLDPFGVRYSSDGTRLLGFEQRLPRRYAVKDGCRVICCSDDSYFTLSALGCFDDLEELIFPEGLEVIADDAFRGLRRVKHLVIPSSVRFIGWGAFEDEIFGNNGMDDTDRPEDDRSASAAGRKQTRTSQLERVDILSTDIFIYNFAFYGQQWLSSLNFSAPTTDGDEIRIGRNAFGGCTSLRSLSLPAGTTLCENPFVGCHLLDIHTDPRSSYHFNNGFLSNDKDVTFNVLVGYYGADSEVVIPDDINTIGALAFAENDTVRQVVLPQNLIIIGSSAFCRCTRLVSITIPPHVGSIGNSAFADCTALKAVSISGPVVDLEDNLFGGCTALEELTLPDSIKSIHSGTFHNCTSLKTLTLPPYLEHIADNPIACSAVATVVSLSPNFKVENEMLVDCCSDTLLAYFGHADEVTVPDGILQIGTNAFMWNNDLRRIVLPASLRCIGERTFIQCNNLVELHLPSALSSIGSSAFSNCRALTHVDLNEGLTHIGRLAFYDCNALNDVVIPQSVEILESHAFSQNVEVTFAGVPRSIGIIPLTTFRVPKGTAGQFHRLAPQGSNTIIEY